MRMTCATSMALLFAVPVCCIAQDEPEATPVELDVLAASVGTWDAEIEMWPAGPDSPSIKLTGVETNRPFGKHWIASDFESEYMGETMRADTIVEYDLDEEKIVVIIVKHGAYEERMTVRYDEESKTVEWMTKARSPTGEPMLQKTRVTQKNADKRVLVMHMPVKERDEFVKFMQITYVRRK